MKRKERIAFDHYNTLIEEYKDKPSWKGKIRRSGDKCWVDGFDYALSIVSGEAEIPFNSIKNLIHVMNEEVE